MFTIPNAHILGGFTVENSNNVHDGEFLKSLVLTLFGHLQCSLFVEGLNVRL